MVARRRNALWNENKELKKQLAIIREALKEAEAGLGVALPLCKPVEEIEFLDVANAKRSLKKVEQALAQTKEV